MTVLSEAVHAVVELQGAVAGALVDLESGNCLARAGSEEMFSLSLIGAVNAQMLRAEKRLVQEQFPQEDIEDLMITLGKHYHLIRLVQDSDTFPCLFLYVVMARDATNLVMARRKMAEIGNQILQGPDTRQQVELAKLASFLQNPPTTGTLGFNEKLDVVEEEDEEELPPFMREETVMKLLGIAEASYGRAMAA
jgi:hypothetical protein